MLYSEVFQWLPLAALIDDQIYVVHGGISENTMLKDIAQVKRENYASILKPPFLEDNDGESESDIRTKSLKYDDFAEWKQVCTDFQQISFIELKSSHSTLLQLIFEFIDTWRFVEWSKKHARHRSECVPRWRVSIRPEHNQVGDSQEPA